MGPQRLSLTSIAAPLNTAGAPTPATPANSAEIQSYALLGIPWYAIPMMDRNRNRNPHPPTRAAEAEAARRVIIFGDGFSLFVSLEVREDTSITRSVSRDRMDLVPTPW